MQGKFKPRNPQKYIGNVTNIIWRSSWEMHFMQYLDANEDVVAWGSEEIVIDYISPLDGKRHRYFTDMVVHTKNGETLLIEIKPFNQTLEPTPGKRKKTSKQYIHEVTTYLVNKAKWTAAERYCSKKGWKFQILTEKEIYGKNL